MRAHACTARCLPSWAPPRKRVAFGAIEQQGHRIGIYSPGGTGKTTLAAALGPVAFFDLDDSLPVLRSSLADYDIRRADGIAGCDDVRDALHGDGWNDTPRKRRPTG